MLIPPFLQLLMKRFTPSKHLARLIVSFGIITICTSAVSSYGGLLAVRIILGLAEAGFFPVRSFPSCFLQQLTDKLLLSLCRVSCTHSLPVFRLVRNTADSPSLLLFRLSSPLLFDLSLFSSLSPFPSLPPPFLLLSSRNSMYRSFFSFPSQRSNR
jgi:hypothetical protein